MKLNLLRILFIVFGTMMMSCSVQQFTVNSNHKPFENGGKTFGEKTELKSITPSNYTGI